MCYKIIYMFSSNIQAINLILFFLFVIIMFYVLIISIIEKEYLAVKRIVFFLVVYLIINYLFIKLDLDILLFCIYVTIFSIVFFPFQFKKNKKINDIPKLRFDERDIMFSRNELKPYSKNYIDYYKDNPGNLKLDNKFRKNPGLMNEESKFYNRLLFASADANFYTVGQFKKCVDGEKSADKLVMDELKLTTYIRKWGKNIGAHSIGVTRLKDYHIYSNCGRGNNYGNEIKLNHKYAIAITVEMDKFMMTHAPYAPVIMESSQQYLSSGVVAIQIASFIRNLGYNALAHIDGKYQVQCPLVARDAGLGEIGRMGLLMTPDLGPRVRIAVVTTDIPLKENSRKDFSYMMDFCDYCKKCANVCPSSSIPSDSRKVIDGVYRWKINSESCFTYWTKVGTDCGRCMTVCPYSHPNNLFHNLVRIGLKYFPVFRKIAIYLDDFFYGKKPNPVKEKRWMKIEK